ncbi:uncharacterized protein B0I36DRAFT_322126 [Microdochium trichocladiopsis]|uniref:Zn(2)-C6 fungal-type domain-containing protein n=1 Tax=Microdochium trichocladiopsis TaxID=1682393 RepID=A0A9P8Y606_9PEZI|nr:uncharacterized protein B0I36DRAFT_322126 [Microdochium trichocladiopsis]KAH7030612.1 hypothetical protein B0I36DRAFT_322126 [Microdochium trichocladiopsis]
MGRTALACDACRERKRKCDGHQPVCKACRNYGSPCLYGRESHRKRKKYWDRDYVQSLENQVRILSTQTATNRHEDNESTESVCDPTTSRATDTTGANLCLSPRALTEFTSLTWPKYPGFSDEPIFVGPGCFNNPFGKSLVAFEIPAVEIDSRETVTVSHLSQDAELKEHLKKVFLEKINIYYNFVEEPWLQFSGLFPENDLALQFLYSTIFGIAAHCSTRTSHREAECFINYAESLVSQCCREHPCISVLRGLVILSCYKNAVLDCSQGWIYHYMAIGMSSTLNVDQSHPSPAESTKPLDMAARDTRVRTLWTLLFVDGLGTPTLGANVRMLWDMSEAPSYLSTLAPGSISTSDVAFESHCQLVRIQQNHLDPIYSPSFRNLPWGKREDLFLGAYSALTLFRQNVDPCLLLTRTSRPERSQITLWISYHATCISLHRRYLSPADSQSAARSQSSLYEISAAASEIARLLQKLESLGELHMVPSFVAYHVLRAGLVHALNMTGGGKLRREAARSLRVCVAALETLRDHTWPVLSHHILSFFHTTMASWGVDGSMKTVPAG